MCVCVCGGGNSDNLSGLFKLDMVQVENFLCGWGERGLLGQLFVCVTQDGQPETDTGANQYQLATAADNSFVVFKVEALEVHHKVENKIDTGGVCPAACTSSNLPQNNFRHLIRHARPDTS